MFFVFGCQSSLLLVSILCRCRQENPGCIANALLLAYKASTQERSGQWIILNQINMDLISLAGLPRHDFHRGAEYKMTRADGGKDWGFPRWIVKGNESVSPPDWKCQPPCCLFSRDIEIKSHESDWEKHPWVTQHSIDEGLSLRGRNTSSQICNLNEHQQRAQRSRQHLE